MGERLVVLATAPWRMHELRWVRGPELIRDSGLKLRRNSGYVTKSVAITCD